jgi:hypothetical protein
MAGNEIKKRLKLETTRFYRTVCIGREKNINQSYIGISGLWIRNGFHADSDPAL